MVTPALHYKMPETIAQVTNEYDCLEGTPWENLGTKVPPQATVDEMLEAAGLDWKVIKSRSVIEVEMDAREYKIARVLRPDIYSATEREDGTYLVRIPNPKSFGLVRSTDLRVLSPYMGDRYKPIQNNDAFEVFQEFVRAGNMTMETAGSLSGGEHVWGLAKIGKDFELADGEIISGYFLLLQSHSYGHALRAMFTPIRYPGGHTFVQNINLKGVGGRTTYSMSHARKFNEERIEEINELLGIASKSLEDFRADAELMANSKFDEKTAVFYLAQVFNPELIMKRKLDKKDLPSNLNELTDTSDANRVIKRAASIVKDYPGSDLPSCKGTAWGYYNAVAHAFDHEFGHNDDTRLHSAWLGKNRERKQKALDLAKIMATAAPNVNG